jgi:hypothetical protein
LRRAACFSLDAAPASVHRRAMKGANDEAEPGVRRVVISRGNRDAADEAWMREAGDIVAAMIDDGSRCASRALDEGREISVAHVGASDEGEAYYAELHRAGAPEQAVEGKAVVLVKPDALIVM